MPVRHLLTLTDLTVAELRQVIDRAIDLKAQRARGQLPPLLAHKVLTMIFEKSSTRTRVAFETAMAESGGHAIFLSPRDAQLGRGETIEDTARVISRMCNAIMVRANSHEAVERLAAAATVPVINGLTDRCHPLQVIADLQTYQEHRGAISGRTVAWVGDGNNMCYSYIEAAVMLGFNLRIACPLPYQPVSPLLDASNVMVTDDVRAAVHGADLIVTDVWTSMGQEDEQSARVAAFAAYQVNQALLDLAQPDVVFMHCLPAHRGEEVSAEVIDGPHSVVWDEAENRLHAHKALLEFLIG
ncbi:MAG: ornithine carbamoyltransferase [Gammaproteobacteria bacterium]|nr:ornithine carbamoyltransferase [Gammaproteobacteria bacterium]